MVEQEVLATQTKPAALAISGATKTKFERWAQKFKVDEGYILSIFVGKMAEFNDERKAQNATYGELVNESGRTAYYVYMLRDEGPVDMFEMMRNKVKKMLDNPERYDEAIENKMAWADGTVLDYRRSIFGKPNPKYGAPLVGSNWTRQMRALVATTEDFADATVCEIRGQDEAAKDIPLVEVGEYYKAFINKSKNPQRYNLGKTSAFKKIIPTVSNITLANKLNVIDLSQRELEIVYNTEFAGKRNTRYLAPIRGIVGWMTLDVFRGGRPFLLIDEGTEESVRVRLPEDVPVTFHQADELVAFCRLYLGRDGKIGAEAQAYLVI